MLSPLSLSSDLSACTRCAGVRSVSLRDFRDAMTDRRYRDLLEFHVRSHGERQLEAALGELLRSLPPEARDAAERLADRWDRRMETTEVWGETGDVAVDRICDEAAELLREREADPADDLLFDLFEIVTLRFALGATRSSDLRRVMGIRRRGFLLRHRWWLLSAAVLGVSATLVTDATVRLLLWAGVAAALLPPAARLVSSADEQERGQRGRGEAPR